MHAIAVRDLGVAVLELGGGRRREDEPIDHAVGLVDVAGLGEEVGPGGRPLAVVHARDAAAAERAAAQVRAAFAVGDPSRPRCRRSPRRWRERRARRAPRPPRGDRDARTSSAGWRARNGITIPPGTLDGDRYVWHDFLDFLRTFDRAVTVIRTAEDYRDITFEYLQACAAEGAIYVEVTVSPDHAAQAGLALRRHARRRRAGDRRRARGERDREPDDRHRGAQLRRRARRGGRPHRGGSSRIRT